MSREELLELTIRALHRALQNELRFERLRNTMLKPVHEGHK